MDKVDKLRTLADPAPATAAALGESRARVLDLLRSTDGRFSVQDVAERVGLHPNTARFHLDGLVEAGLADRAADADGQPGRPRTVYHARPAAAAAGQRSYRLLAEILTTLVAQHLPPSAAAEAGRTWGAYLADRPAPFERVDADEAVGRLVGLLAEIGFDPEAESWGEGEGEGDRDTRLWLRHCPFREVAEHHRTTVCALHLGLMQGALAELRAPVVAERLEPFVEPKLCVAHLKRADG